MSKPSQIKNADFALFTVLWNQRQNQRTPDLHYRMARWLEKESKAHDARLLLQAFRGSGKSTVAGLYAAWGLYRNPDLRILAIAADEALATKMVRNVKRILERHPLTKHLKPKAAEEWASDRFTVQRWIALRDPSMLAKGIGANITGTRADLIICDDVEVPNTSDSAAKRIDLRERLRELSFILTPGGTMLYLGTPHTYYTIYADAPRTEIGEEKEFLQGYARLTLPIMDAQGDSQWIERFSPTQIDQIRRTSGPARFASQMLLQPRNIAEARLDPSQLQFYDEALDYTRELNALFIGGHKMVGASAWWDPAFGRAGGDRSVLAVAFGDAEGRLYLHRMAYIKPPTDETDEATAQCQQVAQIAKDLYLPSLSIETNGIGKFLPGLLRNTLARNRTPCAVLEITSRQNKDNRILNAFDVVLAARRLFVHRSVMQTPFMAEMQEWQPGSSKAHDDGLDAAAGALSQQPIRLQRVFGTGGHTWMQNGKPSKVKTEFEV